MRLVLTILLFLTTQAIAEGMAQGESSDRGHQPPVSEDHLEAQRKCLKPSGESTDLTTKQYGDCMDWARNTQEVDRKSAERSCGSKPDDRCIEAHYKYEKMIRGQAESACGGFNAYYKSRSAFGQCFGKQLTAWKKRLPFI